MWINNEEWDTVLRKMIRLEVAAKNRKAEYDAIKTILKEHGLFSETHYGFTGLKIIPASSVTKAINQIKEYLNVEEKNDPPRTYLGKK